MVKNSRDLKFSPYRRRSMQNRRTPGGGNAAPAANIKVVVRVRPPNSRELGENSRTCVRVVDDNMLTFDPKEESVPFFYHGVQQKGRDLLKRANKNMQFMFDTVFGFDSTNDDVFEKTTKDIINVIMDGYNCAVFVYGATGAGKTHTMLGKTNEPGITYLTMRELFTKMDSLREERDFDVAITYLEVYNEAVQDLLKPGKILQLREDSTYGVQVSGITFERIGNVDELLTLLDRGNQNRTQHPTDANKESSRSHAVFQVYVRMTTKTTSQVRMAKLSMIDLAGSERGAATGCSGMRFTEGANINRSLLALGNCINSLADGQRHVPYRDSKLTRLLKDSLGGNCRTVMIANISPSSLSYEDTYNTLKYATRAKAIKMKMKKNIVNCDLHVAQYKKMLEEMKLENERLTALLATQATSTVSIQPSVSVSTVSTSTWEDTHENNEIDIDDLYTQLIEAFKEKQELSKSICTIESSKKTLSIRKYFKEDAENRLERLRSFDQNSVSKSRERLTSSITAFEKQMATYDNQLSVLLEKQKDIDLKLKTLLAEARSVLSEGEIKIADVICKGMRGLDQTLIDGVVEHQNRLNGVRNAEMSVQNSLIREMAKVLQLFYMVLEEKNALIEPMRKDYTKLIKNLEGYRNVLWQDEDDIADNVPVSSINDIQSITSICLNTISLSSIEGDPVVTENKCMSSSPLKRKIVDETFTTTSKDDSIGDTPSNHLDYLNTYTKSPFRDINKVTADNILYKRPRIVKSVLNKVAQVPVTSRSLFKENRPVQRYPLRKKIGETKGMLSSQAPVTCSASLKKPFTKPRTPFK